MAGTKVSPPPINTQIVDPVTGIPTRPFVEFVRQIWERTGGSNDDIDDLDLTNAYPVFRPAGPVDPEDSQPTFLFLHTAGTNSAEDMQPSFETVTALVQANAPEQEIMDAVESLRATTLARINALHSDIGELRDRVDQLAQLAQSMASATGNRT